MSHFVSEQVSSKEQFQLLLLSCFGIFFASCKMCLIFVTLNLRKRTVENLREEALCHGPLLSVPTSYFIQITWKKNQKNPCCAASTCLRSAWHIRMKNLRTLKTRLLESDKGRKSLPILQNPAYATGRAYSQSPFCHKAKFFLDSLPKMLYNCFANLNIKILLVEAMRLEITSS